VNYLIEGDLYKMSLISIFSLSLLNTDLLYSCVHFIVKIDEKISLNHGIQYLMVAYIFGHPV